VAAAVDARTGALGGGRLRRHDVAGIGLSGAVVPGLVLIGFGAAFSFVAASRFRWEEALAKS